MTTSATTTAPARVAELDVLRGLAERLETAQHGQAGKLVAEVATLLGCSIQQVYRKLKTDLAWASGRKRRVDAGSMTVSEDTALAAAHLVHIATRANGKRTMPITVARDVLCESGYDEAGVSASTLSRAMRRHGCHPAMLAMGKPSVHLRSLHPNHCWQVDPSLCVLFYLPKGGLAVMEEAKFYKNKPGNVQKIERERVWRYVITDHYSGTIYVRYVLSAGETAQGLVDVFLDAISQRGLHDPMHGVPNILLMDAGSANTSHLFLNLLDRLSVDHRVHMPGNARAKGSVENANNLVETQFEGRLRFMAVRSVEELQARADEWRQHYNATAIHSRTGKSRNDIWMTIAEDQLRLAPDLALCRELVNTRPVQATVRPDMSITHAVKGHGRNEYDLRLIPGLVPKLKVGVVVNAYRAPAVDVIVHDPATGDDKVWTVEPVKKNAAGFWENAPVIGQEHKAQPETAADRHVKRIAEAAGADPKAPQAPERVNVMADIKQAPEYLPRRGRDLGLDASRREIAPLTLVEAAMQLKNRLGDAWNAEAYAWLGQRYPQGVPVEEIETIYERLSGTGQRVATPLRVVGGAV